MSVTNKEGIKLDLNQVRNQLSEDRDGGKVSKRDYKKAMKGINRIADAQKKGVNYAFTGEGRFNTSTSNGQSVSSKDSGLSVNSKIGLSGRNVSKAMGYAQSLNLTVPEKEKVVTKSFDLSGNPSLNFGKVETGNVRPRIGNSSPTLGLTVPELPSDPRADFESQLRSDAEKAIERTEKNKSSDSETPKVKVNQSDLDSVNTEILDLEKWFDDYKSFFGPFKVGLGDYFKPEFNDRGGFIWDTPENKGKTNSPVPNDSSPLRGQALQEREKRYDELIQKRTDLNKELGIKESQPKEANSRYKNNNIDLRSGLSSILNGSPDETSIDGYGNEVSNKVKMEMPDPALLIPKKGAIKAGLRLTGIQQATNARRSGALDVFNKSFAAEAGTVSKIPLRLNAPVEGVKNVVGKVQYPRVFQGGTQGTVGKAMSKDGPSTAVIRNIINSPRFGWRVKPKISTVTAPKVNTITTTKPKSNVLRPESLRGKGSKKSKRNKNKYESGGTIILKSGGKLKSFYGGGTIGIQDNIAETFAQAMARKEAMAKKRAAFGSPIVSKSNMTTRKFGIQTASLRTPDKIEGNPGKRRTLDVDRNGINNAYNNDGKKFDKDSAINTGLGLYGAASLLTAKRPKAKSPEEISLNIRPAQGDEDMVSRSNKKINESVRQGTAMLRSRTGSDVQSYVQGATAMIDNAGKAKASVLGQNAQLKRQDEVRMSAEINQGKQINFSAKDQFRREQNSVNEQAYAQRVGGAQAAVNNALNFGIQKRAGDRNQAVEREMTGKRYNMIMLNLAESMRDKGVPEEEIIRRLRDYKKVSSFKKGGSIDSEKMISAAYKNVTKANSDLKKIFSEYSKLVSTASIENIKQFNQNIRQVNSRRNITITSI